MTQDLDYLHRLGTALSDYLELLAERQDGSSELHRAIYDAYRLQARLNWATLVALREQAPAPSNSFYRRAHMSTAAELMARVQSARRGPDGFLEIGALHRAFETEVDRLYLVLGPNHFPDDDAPPPKPGSRQG